ncbi:MAG: DUF4954 family protein [Spirochaetales bacterium]|nr:DUF4954 family protein [Spirochaetales bacterium]
MALRKKEKDKYRLLKPDEIQTMTDRGCVCEDWDDVNVVDGFTPEGFKNVIFYGVVKLGRMDKRIESVSGISRKCGVYNAAVHNCTIGDNVYIRNVSNYISNYIIEDDVVIDGINTLEVRGSTTFGNGIRVKVINEGGGREVPIYDRLSAHEAYIIALYRHQIALLDRMRAIIDNYSESVRSGIGVVGKSAHISNCGNIIDVKIGESAEIIGIVRLKSGTVNSSYTAPTKVGAGVIADDFILASGCSVLDGVIIDKCFIGQGTELSKQYSAENSVFFANCGGFHGEACSIFAGPYTVTHHKSTLLIAGLYSFINAGSGSNQSNHMYKLGPVHQGILERGTKTTSNSYLIFPTRIGAFTLVMGRHSARSDTADFPFSYLIEEDGESVLVPGVNIKSVGTIRDSKKWPGRDRRLGSDRLDYITFYLLTPYTVQKMINGKALLQQLRDSAGHSTQKFFHNGVRISRTALDKGIKYYDLGITRFTGNVLVSLLQKNNFSTIEELRECLETGNEYGKSRWLDLAGLIVPEAAVNELFKKIKDGNITKPEELNAEFREMHENYSAYEIAWMTERLEAVLGKSIKELSSEDLLIILEQWITAVESLDNMRCEDARKEFSATAMVGFGIDGDLSDRRKDFIEVRGEENSNDFITQLKDRLMLKQQTVKELKEKLASL